MPKVSQYILRCCVLWGLIGIACAGNLSFFSCFKRQNDTVCTSKECKSLGEMLKKSLNPQVNPCVNFYDHVCHGWASQNPKFEYAKVWTVEEAMSARAWENVKKLLGDKKSTENPEFDLVKNLYKVCVNLPHMDRKDVTTIKSIIQKVGNWPMFFPNTKLDASTHFWSEIESQYVQKTGRSSFFNYYVIDAPDKRKLRMLFTEPFNVYGVVRRYMPWVKDERKHYKMFLKNLIKSVAPKNPADFEEYIDKDLDIILDFRDSFNRTIMRFEEPEVVSMTVAEFNNFYNTEVTSSHAKLDWLAIVRAAAKDGKDPFGVRISNSTVIDVDKPYFRMLAKFLSNYSKTVMANNAHIYFAEKHAIFGPEVKAELEKTFNTGDVTTGKVIYVVDRELECAYQTNQDEILEKMYVQSYFNKDVRKDVMRIFEDTRQLLSNQISESKWLDGNTKVKTLQKLQRMEIQLGYPESYDPDSVHRPGPYDVDPLEADTYYSLEENKIYVSAAYLQWPLYNLKFPYVMHYGALYPLFGHELYHAFDKAGIMYDPLGKKTEWWPINMQNQLAQQRECFVNQYDAYRKAMLPKLHMSPVSKLPSTVNEDLADVMGLKLAYKGFIERFKEEDGACQVIPGFENECCEKLFFIAYASTFCQTMDRDVMKKMVALDTHSLASIRVNGAVANLPEFGKAFKCRDGDPLKLTKTCDLWQK